MTAVLGIDIGGTGIKSAPVDIDTGELLADRFRIMTPRPATPQAVSDVLAEHCRHFDWSGPIGCAFPGVVRRGQILTAANMDTSWVGVNAAELFSVQLGSPVTMLNDADAAGIAESRFGAAAGVDGVVIVVTVGTGIGTAILVDGTLVPNTEFGHLALAGSTAEELASTRIREAEDLSLEEWARRLSSFLVELDRLFWPDLFVLGGGISKRFKEYEDYLSAPTRTVPAAMKNRAGIVGAAMAAGL